MPDTSSSNSFGLNRSAIAASIALIAFLGFVFLNLDLGWLPNDDGTLGHEAQRVLSGESPHIDFDVPYTGGLSYLNAGAMDVFGENLLSIRYPFYVLLTAWIFVAFAIMRRFLSPVLAAGSVIGAALASVFMYMTPMPTWYNLFLGTLALYTTLLYTQTRHRRWLLVAGLLLGLSLLAKTTGAYFGLAIGYLLIHADVDANSEAHQRALARLFLIGSVVSVSFLVASAASFNRMVGLVIPIVLVAWVVDRTVQERPLPMEGPRERLSLAKSFAFVTVGVLLPVAGFAGFFALQDGLPVLVDSLFSVPSLFISDLSRDFPSPLFMIVPVGIGYILVRLSRQEVIAERWVLAGLVLVPGIWYLIDARSILLVFHYTVAIWVPTLVGVMYWASRRRRSAHDPRSTALLALVAGAVAFQLVRFPGSSQYYTIYAFPLAALATIGTSGWASQRVQRTVVVALLVCGAVFGVSKVNGSMFASNYVGTPTQHVKLSTPRGQLRIPSGFGYYNALLPPLVAAVNGGETILAGPDSPEIYFLSDADNQTPAFFDFLSAAKDPVYSFENAYRTIAPDVVVFNTNPVTSDVPDLDGLALADVCESMEVYGQYVLYENCRQTGHS